MDDDDDDDDDYYDYDDVDDDDYDYYDDDDYDDDDYDDDDDDLLDTHIIIALVILEQWFPTYGSYPNQASLNSYIKNLHKLNQIRSLFIYRIRACSHLSKNYKGYKSY